MNCPRCKKEDPQRQITLGTPYCRDCDFECMPGGKYYKEMNGKKAYNNIAGEHIFKNGERVSSKKESGIPGQSIDLDTYQFTNDKDTNEQIKQLINDAYKKEQPGIKLPSRDTGKKESNNKLSYELDRYFIEAMAKRMDQHKGKYPPYNRQKPMDVQKIKEALNRHNVEIQKGNYDDEDKLDHLSAIACNAMFIYYQLKSGHTTKM